MRRFVTAAFVGTLFLLAAGPATAGDSAPRERFLKDGDAKALAAALAGSPDLADQLDRGLAQRIVGPFEADGWPAGAPVVLDAVDALRAGSLERARAIRAWDDDRTVRASWLRALVGARAGDDEAAASRLLSPPSPTAADAFSLALLGAALPADDRLLLAAIAIRAAVRAASEGKAPLAAALAEGAALVDAGSATRSLVAVSRALRRGGKSSESLMLCLGPAALRAGLGVPTLRLERALSRWRIGDAKGAKGEASAVASPEESVWAFEALARAAGTAPGQASLPPSSPEGDVDAWTLAALSTAAGVPARPEDVVAKAKAKGSSTSDPTFHRAFLADAGVAAVELAGDEGAVTSLVAKGASVVVWRIRRRGDRFRDVPAFVRGHDQATGLLAIDDPDADALDAMPAAWLAKSRSIVAFPAARAAELATPRSSPAARLGAALADALAVLSSDKPTGASPRLQKRATDFPGSPVLDLYTGYAAYAAALSSDDASGLARWSGDLARSGATPPVFAVERFAASERALATGAIDAALAALEEAARAEGDSLHLREARALALAAGRRFADALRAVDAAVALDPFQARVRRRRAALREATGDSEGAKSDLVRVLDRSPGDVGAAEGLATIAMKAGDVARALSITRATERAAAGGPSAGVASRLRRAVEAEAVSRAKRVEDLVPLAASPDVEIRVGVAATAATFDGPVAEGLLASLLADREALVRQRAAMSYGRSSFVARLAAEPALLARLSGPLATDESPVVREALASVLAAVRSEAALAALVARLLGATRDPAAGVRLAIAQGVGARDGATARRALVGALADDEPAVRVAAIRALSRFTGTDRGFRADEVPEKRAAALSAWNAWLTAGAR